MEIELLAKAFRIRKGLNQVQMAKLVGCAVCTYSNFENGKQNLNGKYLIPLLSLVVPTFKDAALAELANAEIFFGKLVSKDSVVRIYRHEKRK